MSLNHAIALLVALSLVAVGVCLGYLAWGRQAVEVVERSAPPINHPDGSVTAAKVTHEGPRKRPPSKPRGRDVRAVELEVLPDPVVCPASGEVVQCRPVALRLDVTEVEDGLRVSAIAEGGEILDAADYPLAPWVKLAGRRNLVQVSGDQEGRRTATYSRKVLGRFWVGPYVATAPGQPSTAGLSLGVEF